MKDRVPLERIKCQENHFQYVNVVANVVSCTADIIIIVTVIFIVVVIMTL